VDTSASQASVSVDALIRDRYYQKQMRILVVDDNSGVRTIIQHWLARSGWKFVLTADGNEGVKQYLEQGPFDVVLTDVYHPGLDGLQLSKTIRGANDKQVIVVFSGGMSKAYTRSFQNLGIPILLRPIDMRRLVPFIARSVRHSAEN
jgi:DNA-binding NtrC family response regulator